MAGGADYLLLETCQDTRNVKAGLLGIERRLRRAGWQLPVAVSVTIETTGTMLAGQDAEALAVSLAARRPALRRAQLRHRPRVHDATTCARCPRSARTRVACVPNAGLPDEDGQLPREPGAVRAQVFGRFLDAGWLNLVGGCCGTTGGHIAALAELVARAAAAPVPHHRRALVSGLEAVELDRRQPAAAGGRAHQRARQSRKFKRADRRPATSRTPPRSAARRCAAARRSSTSACRTPTATRSPTSRRFLDRLDAAWSRCR